MYTKIVHPTDFSEASLPALQSAHELAEAFGAKLIVCFIANPPLVGSGNKLTDPATNESRDLAAELEGHRAASPSVNRELRVLVTESSTRTKKLIGFLEEMGADLLVMGMHRRSGLAGWLGFSITEDFVRTAHCAVLVVKNEPPLATQQPAIDSSEVLDKEAAE
ncbi:MAG: universal stress protein [Pirellulaceae bacterium]